MNVSGKIASSYLTSFAASRPYAASRPLRHFTPPRGRAFAAADGGVA